MFGSGKVSLEASLEREVYYHGEDIPLTISINNQSKKAVKNIRVNEKYFTFYTREFGGSVPCSVPHQPELRAEHGQRAVLLQGGQARQPGRLPGQLGLQVSCDWWRRGHVTSVLISDWSPASTEPSSSSRWRRTARACAASAWTPRSARSRTRATSPAPGEL